MSAPDTLWYYADASNEPVGPLPFAELERLATAGVIHAATHIIEKGGSEWKKFASVFLPPPPTRVEPIQPPRDERKPITAKAFAGTVTLLEDKIRISRNLFAAIGKGGLTEIPLTAIRSIRWKAPGLLKQGYIQFLLEGPIQTACGFFSIAKDSHAVIFSRARWGAFQALRRQTERKLGFPISEEALAASQPTVTSVLKNASAKVVEFFSNRERRLPTFVALLFLYPLGLVLLSRCRAFTQRVKKIAGLGFGVIFFGVVFSPSLNPKSPATGNSLPAQSNQHSERNVAVRRVSDFLFTFSSGTSTNVGGMEVDDIADMIEGIYVGRISPTEASHYLFGPDAVSAEFVKVVGDYMVYEARTRMRRNYEFAVRRDPAFEKDMEQKYGSREEYFEHVRRAIIDTDSRDISDNPVLQRPVVVVGTAQFTTRTGLVKVVPVVQVVQVAP